MCKHLTYFLAPKNETMNKWTEILVIKFKRAFAFIHNNSKQVEYVNMKISLVCHLNWTKVQVHVFRWTVLSNDYECLTICKLATCNFFYRTLLKAFHLPTHLMNHKFSQELNTQMLLIRIVLIHFTNAKINYLNSRLSLN